MATKKKAKPAAKKAAKKPAPKKAAPKKAVAVKKPAAKPAPEAPPEGDSDAAVPAPKPLKPLTLKQKLALIRVDPATGKCPHGLLPETCSFCMQI